MIYNYYEMTEDAIQQLMYITWRNARPPDRFRLFHANNNPRNAIRGAQLTGMGLIPGVSDFIYVCPLPNPTWYIEVKTPTGKQQPEQISFMNFVRSFGHVYVIVYTLEQHQDAIQRANNNTPPVAYAPPKRYT